MPECTWDASKATDNLKNHRVGFDEACTVFDDIDVLEEPDYEHSEYEQRFWAIGHSAQGRLLLVVYQYAGENRHLISARKATPRERGHYEANRFG